jgi:hypothetical protein
MAVALSVALAACGGGGPGGGGENQQEFQVMVINLSDHDVTATSSTGGDPQQVPQCTATQVQFPLADPFVLSFDNNPVIDSSTLEGGIPGGGSATVLAQVTIQKDGTPKVDKQPYAGRAGGLTPPSKLFVESSCAGTPPSDG